MAAAQIESTDVLVIGGGPAGSTAAALLARAGYKTLLVEKSRHPRFHIGESLLPMNLPILERLGLSGKLQELGVKKMGADFTVPANGGRHLTYRFERAMGTSPGHAYEVRRSEFDQMLFQQALLEGAKVLEDTVALSAAPVDEDAHEVLLRKPNGEQCRCRTRFVVDASGRDTFLARSRKWKKASKKHASAAIFAHFSGVDRRAGDNAGNISIYWFSHGWIWMIPLREGIMSIGAVCTPDYLRNRKGQSPEQFLLETLRLQPDAIERMDSARVEGEVRVTGNYSYGASRMSGPGFLLLGDAFAFIDPVFSSGVYLAMNSAERAIHPVQLWLDGDKKAYRHAVRRFEADVRRGLSAFSWFIFRFTTPAMRRLFENPRNDWQVEQAIISLLAGDVFDNAAVHRRILVFRAIYFITCLAHWRESFAYWIKSRKSRKVPFE